MGPPRLRRLLNVLFIRFTLKFVKLLRLKTDNRSSVGTVNYVTDIIAKFIIYRSNKLKWNE